ncbi:hypothetical protein ACXZ7L_03870 [Vibrio campbellii]|nr:hypothetical protein [Vibrio campbellii]
MDNLRQVPIVALTLSTFVLPSIDIFYAVGILIILLLLLCLKNINYNGVLISILYLLIFSIGGLYSSNLAWTTLSIENLIKVTILSLIAIVYGSYLPNFNLVILRKTLLLILLVVVSSQIFISLNVEPISSFVKVVYLKTELLQNIYKADFKFFLSRNGGLFGNPNQLSKAILFLYIIYLATCANDKVMRSDVFFSFVCAFSIIVSGSRTGFATYSLVTLIFYYRNLTFKHKVIGFISLFFSLAFLLQTELRIIKYNVSDNELGSIQYKLLYLEQYIANAIDNSVLVLLFGSGFMENERLYSDIYIRSLNFGFDSDIGYIISFIGIFGALLIIAHMYLIFIYKNKDYFILPLFLWCVSSSIFYSIKSLMMLFILIIVVNSIRERKNDEKTCLCN